VRDVELSITKLSAEHQEIVMIAGLYNFTHEEVAQMLHISKAAVNNWFNEALDALSEIFLAAGLLSERRPDRRQHQAIRTPFRTAAGAGRKEVRQVDFSITDETVLGKVC
jgi:hypothetical protein